MVRKMLKVIDLFYFFQVSQKYRNALYTMKSTHFFIENEIMFPNQSGFKHVDSCINQILSKIHDIYQSLDPGYELRAVILDI